MARIFLICLILSPFTLAHPEESFDEASHQETSVPFWQNEKIQIATTLIIGSIAAIRLWENHKTKIVTGMAFATPFIPQMLMVFFKVSSEANGGDGVACPISGGACCCGNING